MHLAYSESPTLFIGYYEKRVVIDIKPTLVLCNRIDKGIPRHFGFTKFCLVNSIKYRQGTIRCCCR